MILIVCLAISDDELCTFIWLLMLSHGIEQQKPVFAAVFERYLTIRFTQVEIRYHLLLQPIYFNSISFMKAQGRIGTRATVSIIDNRIASVGRTLNETVG